MTEEQRLIQEFVEWFCGAARLSQNGYYGKTARDKAQALVDAGYKLRDREES